MVYCLRLREPLRGASSSRLPQVARPKGAGPVPADTEGTGMARFVATVRSNRPACVACLPVCPSVLECNSLLPPPLPQPSLLCVACADNLLRSRRRPAARCPVFVRASAARFKTFSLASRLARSAHRRNGPEEALGISRLSFFNVHVRGAAARCQTLTGSATRHRDVPAAAAAPNLRRPGIGIIGQPRVTLGHCRAELDIRVGSRRLRPPAPLRSLAL